MYIIFVYRHRLGNKDNYYVMAIRYYIEVYNVAYR